MIALVKTSQTALKALRRNVTRSALTCVGIIIGIAAVIAMMEIGNGIAALNEKAVGSLGANVLMIQSGNSSSGGISYGAGSSVSLTAEDCDAIVRDAPALRAAAPTVQSRQQVIYGGKNVPPTQIIGSTPAYFDVREWTVEHGSAFTEQDVNNMSKVCVLGQTTARNLFETEDPLGKEIRVGSVSMRVVGVLAKKGASTFGQDQDDTIIAPFTTIKYRVSTGSSSSGSSASGSSAGSAAAQASVNSLDNPYPTGAPKLYPEQSDAEVQNNPRFVRFQNVNNIMAAAASREEIPQAIKQITEVLRERHRLRPDEPDDFSVRDMTEMLSAIGKSTELVATLLLIVAAISLAVGGVGIMNIMLVSVTERTREIGLRMAVGARARDILAQFLIESIVLCLLGGLIGILLGRGTSLLVRATLSWPTAVSYPAIFGSVAVAATVGIVFGFYPAWKASRLDPIEALRYE
ncbi:MAG TPA: ABC transporter permease [Tepidisphaeraceae bacterium]|nr:ABC transporter permease [Tepidisphaeraceae bacterium]